MDRRRALDLNKKASKDKVTEFRPKKSLNLKVADNIALLVVSFNKSKSYSEMLKNYQSMLVFYQMQKRQNRHFLTISWAQRTRQQSN